MIELIKSVIKKAPTFEEKMEEAERLHYNNFRQRVWRNGDGVFEIDKLKDKDFNVLLNEYLKFKIEEDDS